jgi:hypothetical protein
MTDTPNKIKTVRAALTFHRGAGTVKLVLVVFGRGSRRTSRSTGPGESRLSSNDRNRAHEAVTFADNGLQKSRLIRVVAQDEADLSNGCVDALLGVEEDILAP